MNKEKPKFSIITCTYNSDRYLQESIDSVKEQNLKNFEHIFIDGYSEDKTNDIIQDYKKEFPDKVFLYKQKPKGIASAMNFGIQKSKGEILSFLNSDDYYASSNVLQIVERALKSSGKSWCLGNQNFIDDKGAVIKKYKTPLYSYELLKRTNFIPHQATFIRKDLFDKYGKFKNYKFAMDYEMWLRIGQQHLPIQIDDILANFRIHNEGATTKNVRAASIELYNVRRKLKRNSIIKIKDFVNLLAGFIDY